MQHKICFLILTCTLAVLLQSTQGAGDQEEKKGTEITSREMTYTGEQSLVVFSGDVHVLRPDFELWSDELHVFLKSGADLEQNSTGEDENIEKIIARGSVRIKGDGREGRSGLLTYFPDTETVHLEDQPRLLENRNTVEGETIILNLRDNTSQVLGGDRQRVRVIFYPEGDE